MVRIVASGRSTCIGTFHNATVRVGTPCYDGQMVYFDLVDGLQLDEIKRRILQSEAFNESYGFPAIASAAPLVPW